MSPKFHIAQLMILCLIMKILKRNCRRNGVYSLLRHDKAHESIISMQQFGSFVFKAMNEISLIWKVNKQQNDPGKQVLE